MNRSKGSNLSLEEKIVRCKQGIKKSYDIIDRIDLRHINIKMLDTLIKDLRNIYDSFEKIYSTESPDEVCKYIRSFDALQLLLHDTMSELQIASYTLDVFDGLELMERVESMRLIHKNFYNCRMSLKEALHVFLLVE